MVITKKHLPRRTVLRGLGAAVALPLLDDMVPALTALTRTAATPPARLGIVYVPNGIIMDRWTPSSEGSGFVCPPILQPIVKFQDRLTVLSGLSSKEADPLPGEGGGDHARAAATFLTCVHPKETEGADIRAGVSMDQIAAAELGRDTQLASLELTLDSNEFLGACDTGYSCAYINTLSWRTTTTPLPMENDPRAVFERLFGGSDSTDAEARRARIHRQRSVLDVVTEKVARLNSEIGSSGRVKFGEYLDAVRDVERRLHAAEARSSKELPEVVRPAGVPGTFEEHAKLMFDLLALAFQSDLTRVSTFMLSREISYRAYPELGVRDPHHALSHHGGEAEKIAKVVRINVYHMTMFAHFLEKLRSIEDGDGSLLDHSLIVYAGGMSDGNRHNHHNLPVMLLDGAKPSGGRHVRVPQGTPVANLHVSLLARLGIPMEKFGDSTGKLDYLPGV